MQAFICPDPNFKSQNPNIVGVGRDLQGSSNPTSLLKQGHLQQAVQDYKIQVDCFKPGKHIFNVTTTIKKIQTTYFVSISQLPLACWNHWAIRKDISSGKTDLRE